MRSPKQFKTKNRVVLYSITLSYLETSKNLYLIKNTTKRDIIIEMFFRIKIEYLNIITIKKVFLKFKQIGFLFRENDLPCRRLKKKNEYSEKKKK